MQSVSTRGLLPEDISAAHCAPLLSALENKDIATLLEGAQVVSYLAPTLLFSQGDAADRFFIVLEGQVKLMALTEEGAQTVVEVFEPCCSFAEAAMFASRRFPLSAEVAEGSRLIHIPAGTFLRRLADNKPQAFRMLATLSSWQRRLMQEIAEIKGKSPGQRLGSFLLSLTDVEQGPARMHLPMKKAVIASRLGVTPESLSRAMARLKSVGVERAGREIRVADVAQLRAFCREADSD